MFLRVGDEVRHVFDPRVSGRIVEIKYSKGQTMSTGGTFEDKKYALVEDAQGVQTWVSFDDVMKMA